MSSNESSPHASEYLNFKYEEDSPALPLRGEKKDSDTEEAQGALTKESFYGRGSFSNVFDLEGDRVLKLTYIDIKNKSGKVYAPGPSVPPLAETPQDVSPKEAEATKDKLVDDFVEHAVRRKEKYEIISKYLGSHITPIEMFAVVESPRRHIEELRLSFETPEEAENIPTSELAIMEISKQIDKDKEVYSPHYHELIELYSGEEFQREARDFAERSIELLRNERITLDVSNLSNFYVVREKGRRPEDISESEELLGLLEETDVVPVYSNIVFDEGSLQVFDIYPSHELDPVITDENVEFVLDAFEQGDYEALRDFYETPLEERAFITDEWVEQFLDALEIGNVETVATYIERLGYEGLDSEDAQEIIDQLDIVDTELWEYALKSHRAGQKDKFALVGYVYHLDFLRTLSGE